MAALCSKCRHYIFVVFLLLSSFFSSPNLSARRLDVYQTSTHCLAENTGLKNNTKDRHLCTITQLCRVVFSQLRHVSTIRKNLLNSNTSSTCRHNMVNFGPLTAEIGSGVWGTPANFNGFRVLAALLHGTVVVGISQTLRH